MNKYASKTTTKNAVHSKFTLLCYTEHSSEYEENI